MRLFRGLLAVGPAWLVLAVATIATAAPLAALSDHDVALYAAAFGAAERGDVATAEASLAQVSDPCLAGKVQYLELTRAKARTANYQELSNWLNNFGDMPGAGEVYRMALRRKPAGVLPPAPSTLSDAGATGGGFATRPAPESRAAREAYFGGDLRRALWLARASGDAWIAGLAAYRLGDHADALVSFETLAANPAEPDGERAAGGFWAARAAVAAGMPERATSFLKMAAQAPGTFYGMIAVRKLELADDPLGRLIEVAVKAPPPAAAVPSGETALARLMRSDARARRAVALAQVGRPIDAGAELRAGYAQAPDDGARALWMGLMYEVNPTPHTGEIVLASAAPPALSRSAYPTPALAPAGGFTIDRSLVYAIVWQESRFNSLAVSPVGAVGLMQLMPPSAANVAGDDTLKSDPITLFDTGKNLALGQAYITWLAENAGGHDILRTIAAYNGGPTTLARTETLVGPDADSLTLIESLPYAETRAYVRKVMAAYWSYRRQFGAATRTLDAAAADQPLIDIRLDGSTPQQNPQTPAAPARQPLEVLLARPDGG